MNPAPLGEFLCRHHRVPNLDALINRPNGVYGHMPDAWSLMRTRTIGVEGGSVAPHHQPFTFTLGQDRHAQSIHVQFCSSELCRFLDTPQIPESNQWEHPYLKKKVPGDLTRASIYHCTVKHRWSSFDPLVVDVAMNHVHQGVDALEHLTERDQTFEAAGALKGAFMSITATGKDGEECNITPIAMLRQGPTNPEFVKTMALINETNLMNGIVPVPADVCRAAKLPLYAGKAPVPSADALAMRLEKMGLKADDPEQVAKLQEQLAAGWEEQRKGKQDITHWYAIPINHVMAWPLRSPYFRQAHGVEMEMFRFIPQNQKEPILLYYLLANPYFEAMLEDWKSGGVESWLGKVDVRPLHDVSFTLSPYTDSARYPGKKAGDSLTGVVAFRAYLSYAVPPVGLTPEAIATLAPTLSPNFPPADDSISETDKREIAIDSYLQQGSIIN